MLGKPMLGTDGQHLMAPHGALRVCNVTKKRQLEDDLRAVSVVGSVAAPGPPPRRTCRAHRPPRRLELAQRAESQGRDTLPATRPEGGEVRGLVSPCIVIETRPRPALGRLLMPTRLSGVSIHRRLALSGLRGFGAGIRRRGVRRRRLRRGRLDIDHVTRPAEIVGPSARCRERLAFGQRAGQAVAAAGVAPGPPISSSGTTRVSVSGTTGPAAGRWAGPPGLAFGACGPGSTDIGSATGMPLLPMMRSISRST